MLPRSRRLRHTKEIQHTLRTGRCLTTPYLKMCFSPSRAEQTRIACVVGKSVDRSAVQRHKYQRWLRAIAADLLAAEPLPHAYDIVWAATPGIKKAATSRIVLNNLRPHWQKLRATL